MSGEGGGMERGVWGVIGMPLDTLARDWGVPTSPLTCRSFQNGLIFIHLY